jgi:ATP phosphoribosyltransferase regulatory subunit
VKSKTLTSDDKNPALLPSGFADLLPPDAEQEFKAIRLLMDNFAKFGYSRVKPPLVEFEESLFAPGPGAALATETFRLMDPVSHRMMGIRSDITAQIARIASSRLANEARPLRLTYANDVLRTKGGQQRVERQFCQVGCEIVGPEDDEADVEICVMALAGLAALDIQNVTLDLTLPRLADKIFDEKNVNVQERATIKAALANRDIDGLKKIKSAVSDIFIALVKAAGPADKAIKALESADLSKEAKEDVKKLASVCAGLKKAMSGLGLKNIALTIDPAENKDLEYHHGIAFALFAEGSRGELGRGGRYNIVFGGQGLESATGFTLYMDTVRRAMSKPEKREKIFVGAGEGWDVIRKLQSEGWIVARGTGKSGGAERCTHIYENGKVEKQ